MFSETWQICWTRNAHIHPETGISAATSATAVPVLPPLPAPAAEQLGHALSRTAPAQLGILPPSIKGELVNYKR